MSERSERTVDTASARSVDRAQRGSALSRFGHVEPADLPDDLRTRIEAVAEKSGFVPNVFRALGRRPAELRAFLDYHDALMEREGGLSKAERELVVVATSGANHCSYCCLLYTSPSPRDISGSRMPSSA